MPIHGLTERRRLPRLGKIHLGVKAKTAKGVEYPKAVDYFVCPPEVVRVYGEKPIELEIVFPLDQEEVFASQFYRAYSQSRGLVCKGDGLNASRLIDVATKFGEPITAVISGKIATHTTKEIEWVEGITCPGRDCEYYQAKACREIMNLQFLLPKVPGLGIWQLDTSSINSILNINSGLNLIRAIFGGVAGVPLTLSLEPIEVSPDGKKKKVYVLNLRSESTLARLAEMRKQPLHALMPQADDEMPELLYPTPEQETAQNEGEVIEAKAAATVEPATPEQKGDGIEMYRPPIFLISAKQESKIRELIRIKGIKTQEDVDRIKFDAGVRVVPLKELTAEEGDKLIAFLEKKQGAK